MNGLRKLLDQLDNYEKKTADCIQELYSPEKIFNRSFLRLDEELGWINSLLANDRLGKAHQQKENKVSAAVSDLNQLILDLERACTTPLADSPSCDPHTVRKAVSHQVAAYLELEDEYAKQCLKEQNAQRVLEKKVFTIMQDMPLQHEKIMSPLMDKCSEFLGEAEMTESFHALTDWEVFERRHANAFAPEERIPIVLTSENHPNEEEYTQFRQIQLHDLEMYRKLWVPEQQDTAPYFEVKLKRAKRKLTPARRDYTSR